MPSGQAKNYKGKREGCPPRAKWKALRYTNSEDHEGITTNLRQKLRNITVKIMQEKIKPSKNCPFEQLQWSVFSKIHSFHGRVN